MKILHLNKSDINGGAARAAYRIHHALKKSNIDSCMKVDHKSSGDWTVQKSHGLTLELRVKINQLLSKIIGLLLKTNNPIIHSLSLFSAGKVAEINNSDMDIVHLHWVQGEMLSIVEISKIKKPIVWTLHDMWAFCGAEHYTFDERYMSAYSKNNRSSYEQGVDINRWIWSRKKKYWKEPIHIVTPSHWLAECVKQSALMRDWPVSVIPNAINTDSWLPIDKIEARRLLNLPSNKKLLLFGAMGGENDPRKGFDLLLIALQQLKKNRIDIELIVFGQLEPEKPFDLGLSVHYMGYVHDDVSLRLLYSAADIMLIPSRQDNLPNTGVESLACGTPVVAFNICGLPDIVKHMQTGYLAEAFKVDDFVKGILWILEDEERQEYLSQNARQYAVNTFSSLKVAEKYKAVYESIVGKK